jgi:translocation and assembly module TamB
MALLASLAYHLQLPLAGLVAVETATALLNREIRGELEIGTLQNVSFEKLVARDVVIRDPRGREVIRVGRVAAWPDWTALWDGVIRIDRARARHGEVTLHVSGPEDGSVSIVDAFTPVEPSPPDAEPPPRVVVDGIVLDDVLVHGDVPGYEDLRIEDLHVEGRVEAQEDIRFRVFDGHGAMTGPYPGRTSIDRLVGHFDTDMTEGLEAFARAHRGEDRVRARIELTRASEDVPPEMNLRVGVDPLHFSTLAEMEIVGGLDALRGAVRGHARLHGPTDDLRLRADLRTDAGRVHVRGRLPAEGGPQLEAWTEDRLQLARLIPDAPEASVGGRVRLDVEEGAPTEDGRIGDLHARIEPLSFAGFAIPGFTFDGVLEEEALRIEDLDTTVADGEASGSGRIGFDGSLDVHVDARIPQIAREPNVRELAPEARGALSANLDVRADEGGENLRLDGRLAMRDARYGDVQADRLELTGRVAPGPGAAPVIRAEGDAEGLQIADLRLGEAHLSIDGGPGGYDITARSRDAAAGTAFELDGRARVTADAITLRAPTLRIALGAGPPWRGHVDLTFRPGRSVELDPLALSRDGERIEVDGVYRFAGPDDVDVDLVNIELAQLRPLAPEALAGLGGRLDGQLQLEGDLDRRPRGRLSATVRDGSFRGVTGVEGRVRLSLEDRTLDTDLELALGDLGEVAVQGPIEVTDAALRDPARLAEEASLEGVQVQARGLDLRLLGMLGLVEDLPVQGRVSTDIELTGRAQMPELRDAILVLDQVAPEGWDPMRAKLRLALGGGRLALRQVWVADARGEIASGEAELPLSLDDLPESGRDLWRQLHESTWSASLRLAERRLDTLPRPLRDFVPPGLTASASLTAEGDEEGPHADLEAVGRFVEAPTEEHCAQDLRPLVNVRAELEGDLVEAHANGFLGGARPALEAVAYASLPLEQWVSRGEVARFPSTELRAVLREAELGQVPWLCSYGRGPVSGSLTAKDLLTGRSVVGAVLDMPHLQIWEATGEGGEEQLSTEYRVHVRAGSSPERDALTACAIMGIAGEGGTEGPRCRDVSQAAPGELISRLRVPVTWREGALLPALVEDQRISSWTDFASAHVEPVLTFIPGVVSGDVIMDGELVAAGPLAAVRMNGEVELSDGRVQIEGLGQHLQEISGRVLFREDEAIFPEEAPLRARDAGGTALLWGSVDFDGLVPRGLDLTAQADEFPVRREGMVLAWLSGGASIEGTIADERTTSTIRTRNFSVRLPDQTPGELQSLEPHPEVLIVGTERPAMPGAAQDSYPVVVDIEAEDPFWVRRSDFSALVTADLHAVYRDPQLLVSGDAGIRRGVFEIFGKRFELTEGRMAFDGSPELDPDVRIVAVYEVPGQQGATVTVTVTGTLTDPQVDFRSTETDDRAEIIALLVSGPRRRGVGAAEQQASEQAASFLAGLTAGILTLGLRQEFGDVIPVLAIESQGLGGTRIRAGINANDLIPDFLRGFVLDAYIEGFLTAAAEGQNAAGSTAGTGGVGGGVTVEFTLPNSFLLRGSYVPVDNGSLDLFYEP